MRMRIVLKSPNNPSARRAVKKGVMYYALSICSAYDVYQKFVEIRDILWLIT